MTEIAPDSDAAVEPRASSRKKLGALCWVAIAAILICTLWPFNPFPRNGAHWLRGGTGIEFDRAGVVLSKLPLNFERDVASESCTVELLLRPASVDAAYTILGFYVPDSPRQFLVRQWTDGLLVSHGFVDKPDKFRSAKFDVDHAFHPGRLLLVTITSGPNGTAVYLDGRESQVFPRFRVSQRDLAGQIVLGTAPADYQPWLGEVHGLAIYSKELTSADAYRHYLDWTGAGAHAFDADGAVARYTFTEAAGREVRNDVGGGPDLQIPGSFSVPHKVLLRSPVKEFNKNWGYVNDVVLNIAGFLPLGLIVCSYLACTKTRPAAILYSIFVGGTLSFVIEVLQAYIPRRVSGITDIITNTLGAALGALLVQSSVVRRILAKIRLIPGAS